VYSELEGCGYNVRVDYDYGDRTYYYDLQGALVGYVADSTVGSTVCGVIPSCNVIRKCQLCGTNLGGSDCPTSVWD